MVPETPLEFGVAERLSQTFRAESMRLHAEAPHILWADSASTTYLIYRIPYVLIGLRIPEEEWRGKDTSLTHLKAAAQMKCDIAFGIRRVTRLSKAEILHLWTRFIEPENDSIVVEHGLSLEITKSPGGSPDKSERSENSGNFKDSGRSDEEYSEDGASCKEGGSKTPQMFKAKEEQNSWKRYKARLVVKGFQQKRGVDYNEIFSPVVKMIIIQLVLSIVAVGAFLLLEMKDRCSEKQVLGYVLTVGVTTVDWAKLVWILKSEGSLSLLKILGTKSLVAMFTREVRAVALLKGRLFEVYRDYLRRREVGQPQVNLDSTIAQFGTGRAVWHEPEQFSSKFNNISLWCARAVYRTEVCAGAIYPNTIAPNEDEMQTLINMLNMLSSYKFDSTMKASTLTSAPTIAASTSLRIKDGIVELKSDMIEGEPWVYGVGFVTIKLSGKWMAKNIRKMLRDGIDTWTPRQKLEFKSTIVNLTRGWFNKRIKRPRVSMRFRFGWICLGFVWCCADYCLLTVGLGWQNRRCCVFLPQCGGRDRFSGAQDVEVWVNVVWLGRGVEIFVVL
ncbi:retrovirus-related pol polyprotein from transposon TNT 1-94 [Tanacetum coccineum]